VTLYLLSFRPDMQRLLALAARERLLPPGGDLGYALHAVFAASFGDFAPKPYRLFAPGEPGGGPSGRLLAYAPRPLAELTRRAALYADPAFLNVLAPDTADDKPMPTDFAPGTRLGFSVRLRPVQRTGASRDGETRGRERDVYRGQPGPMNAAATRAAVYRAWLAQYLRRDGAAVMSDATAVNAIRQTKLFARDRSEDARRNRAVDGPDVTVDGVLEIDNPPAFAALLERGVGRFRAFGFGMLLLRPPT
jgi:CRISPR system Cascade subunit CasE